MKKNKLKLIMVAVSISILFSITGCSSSASSDTKTEKLALTKENVQKVFADKYEVSSFNEVNNSLGADFSTKIDIPKSKARETLKEVEDALHKNFNIVDKNSINIYNSHDNLLISDEGGVIQIKSAPTIDIENAYYTYSYSMSKKFNLLNPYENTKITANDKEDGDLTSKIKLKNPEILTKIGEHQLIYEVTDSDGNIYDNELKINVEK